MAGPHPESFKALTSGLVSTLYTAPLGLVVSLIFGADNLSRRLYGNVLRGHSVEEVFHHSSSPDFWD